MANMSSAGNFRRKREDTKIGTIEKQYGVDLGARSDMQLGQYLKQKGLPSLTKALERATRKGGK